MSSPRLQAFLLLVICLVMFWLRLGHLGLIDPDEPFYALTTREMVESSDWITPRIFGNAQFEKPIFFYWQTMLAQKILGDTELAARVPSAVFATAIVFLVWLFGRRLFSPMAGFLSAAVLATGMEFALMARLMLTDICLAFFITLAMYAFWMAVHDERRRNGWVCLQLIASALATLTKGPIGLLFPALGCLAYLKLTKTPSPWRGRGLWLGIVAWVVVAVPWYATMFAKFGWEYWDRFFIHENWERIIRAEHAHSNHWWYYPLIIFVGTLPWIPLVAVSLMRWWGDAKSQKQVLFLACWFVPSLAFLTVVQSKLPSYIFFLFMPLGLLCGPVLESWMEKGFRSRGEKILAGFFAVVLPLIFIGFYPVSHFLSQHGSVAAGKVIDTYGGYAWLANMLAIPFVVNGVALLFSRIKIAAWSMVLTSLYIVGLALFYVASDIESLSSTRTLGRKISDYRKPGEPLVTASFLTRAVNYYHGQRPAAEYDEGHDAHFTHQGLPVIARDRELAKFAAEYPSVICVGQTRDFKDLTRPKSVLKDRCELLYRLGDRVIFRVNPAKPDNR